MIRAMDVRCPECLAPMEERCWSFSRDGASVALKRSHRSWLSAAEAASRARLAAEEARARCRSQDRKQA